jgi:hypothetical protein
VYYFSQEASGDSSGKRNSPEEDADESGTSRGESKSNELKDLDVRDDATSSDSDGKWLLCEQRMFLYIRRNFHYPTSTYCVA